MMAFAVMNFMSVVSLRGLLRKPSMVWFPFFTMFCSSSIPDPDSVGSGGIGFDVSQAGRDVPMGRGGLRTALGFATVYWQWQAWTLWFPAVLVFGSAAVAYTMWPQSFDSALAHNKFYSMAVLLIIFWAVTLFTFRGIAASSN